MNLNALSIDDLRTLIKRSEIRMEKRKRSYEADMMADEKFRDGLISVIAGLESGKADSTNDASSIEKPILKKYGRVMASVKEFVNSTSKVKFSPIDIANELSNNGIQLGAASISRALKRMHKKGEIFIHQYGLGRQFTIYQKTPKPDSRPQPLSGGSSKDL
jgi:hypothetical protein